MGRADTPTKDRGKPYQRSPRDGTPQRESPGLLKSLFSKMLSPFKRSDDSLASPEKIARRLTAGPAINDQDVFGDLERGTAQMNGDVHRDHKAGPSKERLEKQESPIAPIQSALSSLEPISPTTSTRLLSNFLARKACLGQGGQQTMEEEAAVKELLRRAEEDTPKTPRIGMRSESKNSGRRLFGPIGGRGLTRSGSADVNVSSFGSREGLHSSTPLRHSVLLKATGQPHPISASPTTPSFSLSTSMSTPTLSQLARTRARSEESGVRLSPVTGRPVLGRTPRKYGGPGMGSVGGSPAHVRSSVAQIVSGRNRSGESSTSIRAPQPTINKSSPGKLSDAASILVDILAKTAAESKAKTPPTLINPYEPLTFHIGSSGSTTTPQQSILKTRSRPSTLDRARRKELEQANEKREGEMTGDKRMSDWELIQVGMGSDERKKKRSRIDDAPKPPIPSASSIQPEHMELDSSPRRSASPDRSISDAYRPSERFIVPPLVSSSPSTVTSSTTPFTSKVNAPTSTAFDVIMQTVKSSVPKPRPAEQTLSIAPKPVHPFSHGTNSSFSFGNTAEKPIASTITSSASTSTNLKPSAATTPSVTADTSTPAGAPILSSMDRIASIHPATLPLFTFVALAHAPDLSKALRGVGSVIMNETDETLQKFSFLGELEEEEKRDVDTPTTNGFKGHDSISKTLSTKAPPAGWKCDLCGLVSSVGSVKCDICEAPKPGQSKPTTSSGPPAPTTGFTGWGAATATPVSSSTSTSSPSGFTGWGSAPAAKPAGWKCGTCGLVSSPSSVKCDICEAPKPTSLSNNGTTTSAPSGFAGWGSGLNAAPSAPSLATPSSSTGGSHEKWKCGLCGLMSGGSSVKCDVCDEPRR